MQSAAKHLARGSNSIDWITGVRKMLRLCLMRRMRCMTGLYRYFGTSPVTKKLFELAKIILNRSCSSSVRAVEASLPLRCTGSSEAVETLRLRGRQMSVTSY